MLRPTPRIDRAEHRRAKQRASPSVTDVDKRRQTAEAKRQAKLIGESRDSAEALEWINRNGPLADPDE